MLEAIAYAARVDQEAADDFVVTFPDIPEAITGGAARQAALEQAPDALAAAVEGYLLDGRATPPRRAAAAGEVTIPLPPALAARVLLAECMAAEHLSKSGLAQRIGRDEKVVRRVLSGSNVSLDLVLDILGQLGVRTALAV